MAKQFWADASTKNCVWLFQVKENLYGEMGCQCGSFDEEGEELKGCTCAITSWRTENVFLTKEEAINHGESRPYAWGRYKEGWRIWGVMAIGLMPEILGKHTDLFKDKVEYVPPYVKCRLKTQDIWDNTPDKLKPFDTISLIFHRRLVRRLCIFAIKILILDRVKTGIDKLPAIMSDEQLDNIKNKKESEQDG